MAHLVGVRGAAAAGSDEAKHALAFALLGTAPNDWPKSVRVSTGPSRASKVAAQAY